MDNIFLTTMMYNIVIPWFNIAVDTLKHVWSMLKIHKCILFGPKVVFLVIYMSNGGNFPLESKMYVVSNFGPPVKFSDLLMLIKILILLPLDSNVQATNNSFPLPS